MKRIIPSTDHLGKEYRNWKVMCKSYGVSPALFEKRLRGGMDVETALTSPVGRAIPCTDHLGREYPSRKAMCDAWNIDPTVYANRLKHEMGVEAALTTPVEPVSDGPAEDHTGRVFGSERAMCRAWGVDQNTYRRRIANGFAKEQALTAPPRDTSVTDHTGRTFPSERAMCESWGVAYLTYRGRRARGLDLEAALTSPGSTAPTGKPMKDHTGREFPSVKAMREAWGVGASSYHYRLRHGMSLEDALTAPRNTAPAGKPSTDHAGREFPTVKAMCEAWGISDGAYRRRRKRGMSLREALTGAGMRKEGRRAT